MADLISDATKYIMDKILSEKADKRLVQDKEREKLKNMPFLPQGRNQGVYPMQRADGSMPIYHRSMQLRSCVRAFHW